MRTARKITSNNKDSQRLNEIFKLLRNETNKARQAKAESNLYSTLDDKYVDGNAASTVLFPIYTKMLEIMTDNA